MVTRNSRYAWMTLGGLLCVETGDVRRIAASMHAILGDYKVVHREAQPTLRFVRRADRTHTATPRS